MKNRPEESFSYEEWEKNRTVREGEAVMPGIDPCTLDYQRKKEEIIAKVRTIYDCMNEEEKEETKGMTTKEAIIYLKKKHEDTIVSHTFSDESTVEGVGEGASTEVERG